MIYLIIVSVIWSLSFSLIKGNLSSIDPNFVAFFRLLISLLVFLPLIKIKNLNKKLITHLITIGAVQYGFMYVVYIYSFQFLISRQGQFQQRLTIPFDQSLDHPGIFQQLISINNILIYDLTKKVFSQIGGTFLIFLDRHI